MSGLRVVALVQGEPAASALWTLERLASAPCRLSVLQARQPPIVSDRERIGRLLATEGLWGTVSRAVGSRFIAPRIEARESAALDRLFDVEHLRRWWRTSGIEPIACTHLNHADARTALLALAPDLGVRVSGGLLRREIFSIPRLATLNLHRGRAPIIRGQLSIPWAIVENRRDWIGATIHVIDDGIDTGAVLWRGGAQVAPGDTGARLFFRSHLETVEALLRVIRLYADGQAPPALPPETGESTYRGPPGAHTWMRYLWSGSGARARVTLESAVRC